MNCAKCGQRVASGAVYCGDCAPRWVSVAERLPEEETSVLIFVSGRPRENIELIDAYEFGNYSDAEGWIVEAYPEWERPAVAYWMPLPAMPEEKKDLG